MNRLSSCSVAFQTVTWLFLFVALLRDCPLPFAQTVVTCWPMKWSTALLIALAMGVLTSSTRAAVIGPMPVVLSGTASTSPVGGVYTSFNSPVLNSAGQVAFGANLVASPGTRDFNANVGIFAGTVGSIQPIALRRDPAPGGGTYNFPRTLLALNSQGQVLFTDGPDRIFAGGPGSV
jgi:hypothetical protein